MRNAVDHGTASFELEPPSEAEMTRRHAGAARRRISVPGRGSSTAPSSATPMPGPTGRGRPTASASRTRSMSTPKAQRRGIGRALLDRLIADADAARLPPDDRGDRRFSADALDRAAPRRRLLMIGTFENVGFKFGPLARYRADAARARRGREDEAAIRASWSGTAGGHPRPTMVGPAVSGIGYDRRDSLGLSSTRSTRSSSWPRRTIRPVADTTL